MSLSIFRGYKINETISCPRLVKLWQFMCCSREEEEEVNIIMLQQGTIPYLLSSGTVRWALLDCWRHFLGVWRSEDWTIKLVMNDLSVWPTWLLLFGRLPIYQARLLPLSTVSGSQLNFPKFIHPEVQVRGTRPPSLTKSVGAFADMRLRILSGLGSGQRDICLYSFSS